MRGPWFRLPARFWLALFCAVTGAYGLLAFIPFTYQAVIRFPMVSWVPSFVRFHAWLFLVAIAWNLWVDWPWLHGAGASRAARLFYGLSGSGAVAMLVRPPLPGIRNDGTSLALALGFFLLPTWLLVLDGLADWRRRAWRPVEADDARRLFLAALTAGLFGAVVFPGIAWFRGGFPAGITLEGQGLVWGWTVWAHLLVCLAAAALLMGVLGLGRFFPWPWAGPGLVTLVFWLGLLRFLQTVVFAPIAFHGALAGLVAGAVATLGVSLLWSTTLSLEPVDDWNENALDLILRPLCLGFRSHLLRAVLGLLASAWLAWFLLGRLAVFDWNFLFQKTLVATTEALVFGGAYAAIPARKPRIVWVWALILLPILGMNLFLAFDEGLADRRLVLDQQAGRDVAVRFLREALAPAVEMKQSIYRVLQANSNIPKDVRTDPVDIRHVDLLKPALGPKPDIYILVVDSLRRDYLGAYNPKVGFTPGLDGFAKESLVLRNAFTRYGATGLSEPSIWTGSLMLHKQYITPFQPMNSLQKLLETDGYHGLISMDSILDVVVKSGPWMESLDPGVGTQDLRLGNSLDKLQAAIRARGKDPRPLFGYTQSQDLHVSVVNREGQGTVVPGDFSGFYAPYASRVRRLDDAFGRFIAFLKAQGRYENSLIIVTADHGDSLGEDGRFGHAYTLFPEIVRIPLLIHLPVSMQHGYRLDTDSVAFLTDLTPSLYYLLGHRPILVDRALGRPLFTTTLEEQTAYRQEHYLLASSYGAVFGILDENGKTLYISDGVNFVDHLYRLDEGLAGTKRPITPELKGRYDQMILGDITMLNHFYHFQPGH